MCCVCVLSDMASVYGEKPEMERAMSKFLIALAFVAIMINSAQADTQV